MLNQSLNELKLIAKSRGIKGYKRMSQNRLLRVLNASESVKKSEKDLDDTESTRNEDYDDDKTLKTTTLYLTKINKNIREIRTEIMMKAKYLEIWILHLIQNKIMNLKKLWVLLIIITCNMKSLEMNTKI